MTEKQFKDELTFEVVMSIFKNLYDKGIITAEEFAIIETKQRSKFSPILGTLYPQNPLINDTNDGNMYHTEDVSSSNIGGAL